MAVLDSFSLTTNLPERSDVVIIGGGTAGLTLASRLSEDSNLQVLVLEAGVDRSSDPTVLTPGLGGKLQGNPQYDWDFPTLPQVSTRALLLFLTWNPQCVD